MTLAQIAATAGDTGSSGMILAEGLGTILIGLGGVDRAEFLGPEVGSRVRAGLSEWNDKF